MLKFFRKKNIAKIIFWGLVVLILPPFVFWGVGGIGRTGQKGPTHAGLINNGKVSFEELFKSMASIRCQIILNYAPQPQILDAFLKNRVFLAKLAWSRLIMLKEAKRHKVNVSDKDVINLIKSHPLFLKNGKFDDKIYQYILRYNIGVDPRSFEEIMRENLKIQRLNDLLTKDISVIDEEVLEEYRKENEKFKISYILIDEKVKSPDTPSAIEIRKKILALIEKEDISFEGAVSRLNLKAVQTPFFSRKDYLEGIGEAQGVVEAAVKLKKDEISSPMETRKGGLIFRIIDAKDFDKEKFEKERIEYSKNVLERKKALFLEGWLRNLESKATLKIDLNDIEKYYR